MEILKMNSFETNVIRGLLLTVLIGLLMACGGGGGGSASTFEPVVAKGVITEMGSIWVNGVEYETPDGGSYSSDDDGGSTTASYEVGQVVSLRGTRNSNGISGTADEVEYEAEIEGTADATGKINDVTILFIEKTNTSMATLSSGALIDGNRYEVSGFWIADKTIEATFIKDEDLSDEPGDEIKGRVEAFTTSPSFTLTVRGVIYTYNGTPAVNKGDYVEIHFDPVTKIATKVELEDDFMDNDREAEVEGVVNVDTTDCPVGTGAEYVVGETCIKLASSVEWEDGLTEPADMVNGIRVEAEGHTNADGLLVADNIKGRGNRVRITAIPTDNNDGTTFTFFSDTATEKTITVTTSEATDMDNIPLADLLDGTTHGVEVRGIRTDDGTGNPEIFATSIRPEDADQRNEIRAEIDLNGANETGSPMTITVLGNTKTVDGSTELQIEDALYTGGDATSFLTLIDDNDDPADGPNDIIDLRFDFGSSVADQIEIELEDD